MRCWLLAYLRGGSHHGNWLPLKRATKSDEQEVLILEMKIHPFTYLLKYNILLVKVYHSLVFRIFTKVYNHHH